MMTVNISQQRQTQMERYCAFSGLSKEVALDNMFEMWERLVYIPEMEFIKQERQRKKAREGFAAVRAQAMRGEFPDLSMVEIDEIIAEVRKEHVKKEALR